MDVISNSAARYVRLREEEMSVDEYLALCQRDPTAYDTAAQRMLRAMGDPVMVDTRNDPRLSRLFANKTIRRYPAFSEFYGMEDSIEQVVSFFRHAGQGLEERKQILYLLGPVGGGKSSIAERLKYLMQKVPFYALKGSPVNESPLGLFDPMEDGPVLEEQFGIPRRALQHVLSPWAVKRLDELGGDIRQFRIVKRYPSILKQLAIAKTEPGDENNQDISSLVGKVDIRKLENYAQDDTDAYSYSGGLCLANQGLLEFVEMFKAPIKVLHPLLTATQEGNYKGTEGFGAIPFDGMVLAHSNESEWKAFRNNRNNEAFLDRIYIVKVPYCLRVSEEVKIYEKLIRESSLAHAVCAPGTLKMMAQFAVLTRLVEPENSSIFSKMQVYDGESLKDTDPRAKSYQEYRDFAGVDEGMSGISTRFAFKILSRVFNYDSTEVAANPVHLMYVLEQQIEREQFPAELETKYTGYIKEYLSPHYAEFIGKEIQTAYLESYSEYGQNIFDRYVTYADYWIQDNEYRDNDTGESFDRAALNAELEKIEKPAGVANPKDFRNEIVNFVLRARANNQGKNPAWTSYEKLRLVIEKKMFSNTEELLPVISFNAKASAEDARKHEDFVLRMEAKGYTRKQVRLLCEWYLRVRKSS
ncbi:PrkA family serine protein kinase [Comamonas antarctica]|uniref:PrkA family serine protein kinase n=1 Tax=Comamonas antarctica TaxID=2743470 RepID=A0A6N1X3P4_9BURK|nr:PrkA family serine protein kinase [Comamonas antarctica]QKV53518.1 PrkA family serine protein kinase [Comamonas antarctica]